MKRKNLSSDKNNLHPKYLLSGEKAKKFKLQILQAVKPAPYTETFKFPLKVNPLDETQRDRLRDEYRTLSSIGENSIFHYYSALLLSGFRIYRSESEAMIGKNTVAINDLRQTLSALLECEFPAKQFLLNLFPEARSTNQSIDAINKRLVKNFKKTDQNNANITAFIATLSDKIVSEKLYSKSQAMDRYNLIGEVLSITIPVLDQSGNGGSMFWDDSTADFLAAVDMTKDFPNEYTMNKLVSLAAYCVRKSGEQVSNDLIKEFLCCSGKYEYFSWGLNAGLSSEKLKPIVSIGQASQSHKENILNIATNLRKTKYKLEALRSLFGGGIASFVSNYWKRLEELKTSINLFDAFIEKFAINDLITEFKAFDSNTDLQLGIEKFERQNITKENLLDLLLSLKDDAQNARQSLQKLCGESETISTNQDVEAIEIFNDRFEICRGLVSTLHQVFVRDQKQTGGDTLQDATKLQEVFKLFGLKSLSKSAEADDVQEERFTPKKINRYVGAVVRNQQQIIEGIDDFNQELADLRNWRKKQLNQLNQHFDFTPNAMIDSRHKTIQTNAGNKTFRPGQLEELSCRYQINSILKAMQKLSAKESMLLGKDFIQTNCVFSNSKHQHQFMELMQGLVYKSPYAKSWHEPYKLGLPFQADLRQATIDFITRFITWVETFDKQKHSHQLKDFLTLENCVCMLKLDCLTKAIPSAFIQYDPDQLHLSALDSWSLDRNTEMNPNTVRKLFSSSASLIQGLSSQLAKVNIIEKIRLQHVDDRNLCYIPKLKNWGLPPQMFDNNDQIIAGSNLAKGWLLLCDNPELFVNKQVKGKTAKIQAEKLPLAIKMLLDSKDSAVSGAVMRQMPHSWFYEAKPYSSLYRDKEDGLSQLPIDTVYFSLAKNNVRMVTKPIQLDKLIRICGPSRYKNWLDDFLVNQADLSDLSLIIEEQYHKTSNFEQTTALEYVTTSVNLAIPFKKKYPTHPLSIFDHFLAIDLGERGIGYAVYKVPNAESSSDEKNIQPELLAADHVIVPQLKRLMSSVNLHRQQTQPKQKFGSNLNLHLQYLRENTIGELAGIINALIQKYSAFPVFESSVGGFESGGNRLKLTYSSILQLYTYSSIDAHKQKRKQHWLSPSKDFLTHPFLYNKDNKSISLFPGVAVHPAGTSQTCSFTNINPTKLFDHTKKYSTDAKGIVTVNKDEKEHQLYIFKTQRNKFPSIQYDVWKNCTFSGEDLKRKIKSSLRFGPPDKNSKDTSQSSYLSPFVATQNMLNKLTEQKLKHKKCFRINDVIYMHADVNAAINIGMKWWDNKVNIEKSFPNVNRPNKIINTQSD